MTQFLQTNEGTIAYDDTGSGPLVLCVPGMGDLRGGYRYLTPQLLAAGFRVVTMDLRGHGETSTGWSDYSQAGTMRDILALIKHLDAGPVVLVGNSMGAGAAIWAAAETPELVSGLILLAPAIRGELTPLYRLMIKTLFSRPWGPAAWKMYYKSLFTTRKPSDLTDFADQIKRNLTEPGRMEALRETMLVSRPTSETRLDEVNAPALIIMGSKDPDFKSPAAEAQWISDGLKGTSKMIEGAGHYPHTEMPEITGPMVVDFLKTLQGEVHYAAAAH